MLASDEEEMDVDDPEPLDDLDLILNGGVTGNEDVENADTGSRDGDVNDDEPANNQDGGTDGEKKEIKKKRVLNPQPKLNYHRLTGNRGLCEMKGVFSDIQLKGKGHELSDLNRVMTKLEYWTHRLFPRYGFDEVLSRIEKLGSKKPVQTYIKRMRLGMDDLLNPISNEFVEDEPPSPSSPPLQPIDDPFDSLMPSAPTDHVTAPADHIATPKPRAEITAEQRARMERNRQLALERRMARIQKEKEEEEHHKLIQDAVKEPSTDAEKASTSYIPHNSTESGSFEACADPGNGNGNLFECSQDTNTGPQSSGPAAEVLPCNAGNSGEISDNIADPIPEPSRVADTISKSSHFDKPEACDLGDDSPVRKSALSPNDDLKKDGVSITEVERPPDSEIIPNDKSAVEEPEIKR